MARGSARAGAGRTLPPAHARTSVKARKAGVVPRVAAAEVVVVAAAGAAVTGREAGGGSGRIRTVHPATTARAVHSARTRATGAGLGRAGAATRTGRAGAARLGRPRHLPIRLPPRVRELTRP